MFYVFTIKFLEHLIISEELKNDLMENNSANLYLYYISKFGCMKAVTVPLKIKVSQTT